MKEAFFAVLTALVGGGIGAAIVSAYNERWKLKFQRKAAKEDREADKADKTESITEELDDMQKEEEQRNTELNCRLDEMDKRISAQSEGIKLLLLDRILQYGEYLVGKGEITFDERKRFHAMHSCYHDGLKGNGDADLIVDAVDKLPLKHLEVSGL